MGDMAVTVGPLLFFLIFCFLTRTHAQVRDELMEQGLDARSSEIRAILLCLLIMGAIVAVGLTVRFEEQLGEVGRIILIFLGFFIVLPTALYWIFRTDSDKHR